MIERTLNGENLPQEKRGRYFMYLCTDWNLGLPQNKFFSKDFGEAVFGDAFLFRLEDTGSGESGSVKYAKMGPTLDDDMRCIDLLLMFWRWEKRSDYPLV